MDASSALLWLVVLVAGVHAFVSGQETSKGQRQLSQVDDLEEELLELKHTGEEAVLTNKSTLQKEDMYSVFNRRNIGSGNSSRFDSPEDNTPIVNVTGELERFIPPESFDTKQNKQSSSQNAFGKMKEIGQEADKENVNDVQDENDTVVREFHKVAEDLLEMLIHIAERPSQWDKLIQKLNTASQNQDETESLKSRKRQKMNEVFGKNVFQLENMTHTNKYISKYPTKVKQNHTLYNWKDRNSRIKQLLKTGILQPIDQLATFEKHQIDANEVTHFGEKEPPFLHSKVKLEHEKESQIDYKLIYPANEILQLPESEYKENPPKAKQLSQYMNTQNLNSQRKFNETETLINKETSIMGISKSRLQSSGADSSRGIPEARQTLSAGGCNGTAMQESRNSLPEGHRWPHFTYHRVTSRPAHRASHRDAYIAVSVARGAQPGSGVAVGLGLHGPTTPATSSTTAPPRVETIGRVLRMRDPLEEELVEMAADRIPPAPQRTPIPLPVSFVAWSHAQHLNKLQEQIKSLAAMEDKLNYKSADRERLRQILRDGKSDPVHPIRAM